MSHDIEAVTLRWQRRNADRVYRVALFSEFAVGDMLPGTFAYQRLVLAVALQGLVHALRAELRRLLWVNRGPR